jgi:hypothetical protein
MSSYTMQLREYIEHFSQDVSGVSIKDQIETGRTKLFDFDYPIFDEAYKPIFEKHFIRNFYMREIGFETEGLFKFYLENWLTVNMPYWNKMFESELLVYDPLENSKMDVTHTKTNDGSASGKNTGNSQVDSTTGSDSNSSITENGFTRDLESKNPDSRLTITASNGTGVIEYASQIDESTNTNTTTSEGHTGGNNSSTTTNEVDTTATTNEVEDFVQHRAGKIGVQTFPKMIQEHRQALLRIEKDIFKEMNQLFMLVY